MADRNRTEPGHDEWLRNVRNLAMNCPQNPISHAARRVRELNDLMLAAPNTGLLEGLNPLPPSRLEKMLDAGGTDAAALALFGDGASYLLSRSGDDMIIATVTLPATLQEKSAPGNTPALALVGALARALANAATAARFTEETDTPGRVAPGRPHLVSALH